MSLNETISILKGNDLLQKINEIKINTYKIITGGDESETLSELSLPEPKTSTKKSNDMLSQAEYLMSDI
jgi:hypothetical protein